jgi:adenine-specific DNA-methyltransferase
MIKLYDVLVEILKSDSRFVSEGGGILKNAVYEVANKGDPSLLKALWSNEVTRERFFTKVDDNIEVFKTVDFREFISNREFLPDSYTRFANRIGLAYQDESLISKKEDVVLVFPYKDCFLEGGQTKEDQCKDEIFYNVTLAPDEVNSLLSPKVLINATRFTDKGKKAVTDIDEHDNLIIKGNNLLVLQSLLKKFEGKIKCIYIDPPYYFSTKKNEDTFQYNSNFKLSTWLVFMKNRLEVAKRLLSEDGAIFVQISDDGVGELHVLMKEIFNSGNENNFINKITVKTRSPSGFASVNPGVFESAEYILVFAKNKRKWTYNAQYIEAPYDSNYKWIVVNKDKPHTEWEIEDLMDHVAHEQGYESKKEAVKHLPEGIFLKMVGEYALNNSECVFQSTAIGDDAGRDAVEIRDISKNRKNVVFRVDRANHYNIHIYNGREMAFYSKKIRQIDEKFVPSVQLSNMWSDTPYEGIAREGDVKLKGGKKPEKLLKRIIEMSTNKGDIVLDYHLGSGTTCAVAHKLGRQYIGVEQLDYGDNDSTVRIKNVISGDLTGISKSIKWTGGGSFVYCELAKINQVFVEHITNADDSELETLYDKLLSTPFISTKVDLKKVQSSAEQFSELTADDKRHFLFELLDMNMLYVNKSDIDDETYEISQDDKDFSHSFYGDV